METSDFGPLIARCRTGDDAAWEALVRALQGRVFGLACAYVKNREEAADLAQEIFVRLFEARQQWPDGGAFLPWVFQVARHRAIDFLRRERIRRPAFAVPADELPTLADPGDGPEARAIAASRRARLGRALRRISALAREIVMLRDVHGLSVQETASLLDLPIGTVKSRTTRARAELAALLLADLRGGRR